MKRKKKKLKKSVKVVLVLFILFIIIGLILCFSNKNKDSLKAKGYNELEINEINKLTKSEVETIKKYKYNKNISYIINSDNYNSNKLDLYMKYSLKYEKVDYTKIMDVVNNNDFIEKNIDKYMNLLDKYDNVDGIIKYINNYSNIDELAINFVNEKYFIIDNLDRYISYYDKNKSLSFKDIVAQVNSNLDKKSYDDSMPADISKGMYTLVNKYYYLGSDYTGVDIINVPGGNAKLNKTAYENFEKMANAAKKEGLTIQITTAYRDYNFQSILYNNYVKADGVKAADTYSARPGYSEHQLGYSTDLTNGNHVSFGEFENTKEFEWLDKNAYKYGFILRFPKDKENLTGYIYESWHYRYVGVDIAKYIKENNISYEEYYAYFLR